MSGRFPRLPETCQRHGKEVRTKTDRLRSIVEDHSTPEELARHLLQSAQPLEVAAGDRRAGLDLDADQLPSGIFKNDVHFQPGLRPKVKELWLRLSPGRLLAQFADDKVLKDMAKQGTIFDQPLLIRAVLILTIRIGPLCSSNLAHPFDRQFALLLSLPFLHNQGGVPSLTCPVISVCKDNERKKTSLHLSDSSDEFRAS